MGIGIALAPEPDQVGSIGRGNKAAVRERHERLRGSVIEAGGEVVEPERARGLIWLNVGDAGALISLLDAHPSISWVQLPWAGIDSFLGSGLLDRAVTFTSAKGAFAEELAEHALMLSLTGLRQVVVHARVRAWHEVEPNSLYGKRATILGGGGITNALMPLLRPMAGEIVVLRRQTTAIEGASSTRPVTDLHSVLPQTDVLILALALTPETHHIIGAEELALLPPHSVVVNVARGGHIDTTALVEALTQHQIAGAGLDVTDPEPLPSDHPLWGLDNVLITSHCGDSLAFVTQRLAERVRENVARFSHGQPLIGVVDSLAGY
jgi:phosphoglycerate dehydrogenase-like enzyme